MPCMSRRSLPYGVAHIFWGAAGDVSVAALHCRNDRGVEVGAARCELAAPPFNGRRVVAKPTVFLTCGVDSFLERATGGRGVLSDGDANPAVGPERIRHARCPVPSGDHADLDRNRQFPARREQVLDHVPFFFETTQSREDRDELLNRADSGEPARGVGCGARHSDAERQGAGAGRRNIE